MKPMKTALGLRHLAFEDLGLIAPWLERRGWRIHDYDAGIDEPSVWVRNGWRAPDGRQRDWLLPPDQRLGVGYWWRKAKAKEAHHLRVLRDPRRRAAVLQSIRGE
jgi:hypothetical protein